MLSRLVELFELDITIESYNGTSICLDSTHIDIFKNILLIGAKVKAFRTRNGVNKARENGVKLGNH